MLGSALAYSLTTLYLLGGIALVRWLEGLKPPNSADVLLANVLGALVALGYAIGVTV